MRRIRWRRSTRNGPGWRQSSCRRSSEGTCTCECKTSNHVLHLLLEEMEEMAQRNSHWTWQKDIALLQESHLKPDDVTRFQNRFYKPMVAAADGTRTKGTLILMRRGINLTVEKTGSDNEGRMAFCCTSIQGKKVAFVSLYASHWSMVPDRPSWITSTLSAHRWVPFMSLMLAKARETA